MTAFSKTPPTEPVPHYWREHSKAEWKALELFINDIGYLTTNMDDSFQPVEEIGGEWGGRVPAPGTTWTVEQISYYIENLQGKSHQSAAQLLFNAVADIKHQFDGIKATTERNRKEQG